MITELSFANVDGDGDPTVDLVAEVHHVGPVCVLRMAGSLHSGSLYGLQRQFDRLGRTPCRHVVLDLSGLLAIDAAGARLLTGLHHYVAGRGGRLSVICASPAVNAALAGTALAAA